MIVLISFTVTENMIKYQSYGKSLFYCKTDQGGMKWTIPLDPACVLQQNAIFYKLKPIDFSKFQNRQKVVKILKKIHKY